MSNKKLSHLLEPNLKFYFFFMLLFVAAAIPVNWKLALAEAVVTALLKDGRARITGCYSEKTGKTYDATVVLEDDGQYANFKLEFDQQKGGKR